jgi:hypothetical protein
MIIKGASRRNIGFWSRHLTNDKKNDRVELIEKRALVADNLADMMREMQKDTKFAPRCDNFMYIASFNPCAHEHPTEQQWERMYEIFEKHRGIPEGQQRIVYEHEKNARTHRHVVWNRIDTEKMRAFPDGLDLKVCEAAQKEIEHELGLEKTPHLLDREPGVPRPPRGPKAWERMRGDRSQLTPQDVTAEVTAIFRESQNPVDLAAGLQQHGYQLALGDRRGLVILDSAGDVHSLARRLDGINTKQLNAFMQGFDQASLPSVAEAKAQYQERKIATLEADRATVQHEIAWEDTLAKTAIEKDKREGQAGAPEDRQKEKQAGQQEKKTYPVMPEKLVGTAAHIWTAWHQSDTPRAFAAALDEHGISLAAVTKDEAERSRKEAAAAKEQGAFTPRYRGGEIVAVADPDQVYKIDRRTTGEDQVNIERFFAPLDRSYLQGIEATKETLTERTEQRNIETQVVNETSLDTTEAENVTDIHERAWEAETIGENENVMLPATRLANVGSHAIDGALDVVGGGLIFGEKVLDALVDLVDPPTAPAQHEHAAENVPHEHAAQAAQQIEFSNYIAARQQEAQRLQEEQHRSQQRQGSERER